MRALNRPSRRIPKSTIELPSSSIPSNASEYPPSAFPALAVRVTIEHHGEGFTYEVRQPVLTAGDDAALYSVESDSEDAHLERPRTNGGAVETMAAGLDGKHELAIDRLVDSSLYSFDIDQLVLSSSENICAL